MPNSSVNLSFLRYVLETDFENNGFENIYGAKLFNSDLIKNAKFQLPKSIEEQKQIANFLDKKTLAIDKAIEKNKKLIELLEEKRTSLINHVVTKGLDLNAKMKDSGVEWIGEIPEDWKINKIKNTSYVKGRIGWHGLSSDEYSDEGPFLVTGTNFKDGKIDWESCHHIGFERYKQDPYIHLQSNDLLITKDGTIGKLALLDVMPGNSTLNSGIFLTRPLNGIYITKYLYYVLKSDIFKIFLDFTKTGATIAHLYQETFERFFFPIPSINIQKEIVRYLDNKVSKLIGTIKKVEKEISLLEEYKKSLIYHMVTGKCDMSN